VMNLCRLAQCVKLRNPPAQSHFTHIFGLIQMIYPLSTSSDQKGKTDRRDSILQNKFSYQVQLQNELKHIGLYKGFSDDLFIVITFRLPSKGGGHFGVTALQT